MLSRFSFPTNILFGERAVHESGKLAVRLGGARALVVSDPGVVKAGLTEPVSAALASAGVHAALFEGISPNPTDEDVERGLRSFRAHEADIIVGVGGGSALDGAKAIRLKVTHHEPLESYDDNFGGDAKITADMPPMIAIPTTAGTGSEVGRSTVIICRSNQRKTVVFSPYLMPNAAICDPALTVSMPAGITAATGMDALTHNLEAFLAKPWHPMADAIALGGLALCRKSLRRAVEQGADLEARANMLMAAVMGATAFQKGLGVTHSLAHPLSSIAGMHHGTANAVLLPFVLEFNQQACPNRFLDVAKHLDLEPRPESLASWVRELNAAIGITPRLSDYGVNAEMIPAMTAKALEDGCHLNNPRPCAEVDMRALYELAL